MGRALAIFLILLLWAGAMRVCKGRRLFFWLWLPFLLFSLLGTAFGLYCLMAALALSGRAGEAAGFAGAGYFLAFALSIPFMIGLAYSFITRPTSRQDGKGREDA